jgi:hypothetical protein
MLKVLEGEAAIRKYRRQFIKSFKPFVDEKIKVQLGHPGGTVSARILWSDRLGIWMFHEKGVKSRYGHAFGVGKPSGTSPVPITCEINFPPHGIDRRMGGALAYDRQDRIYVVHRGKIGGGKKGVGKVLFEKLYRGVWAHMEDGDAVSTVALVGALNSPRFVRQVAQFIRKIERMKDVMSSRSPQMEITFDEAHFREELVGAGYDPSERFPESDCDHGLVVSDLQGALEKKKFKIENDADCDLCIVDAKRQTTAVFQVMTDNSSAALHAGIAKLLLKSADLAQTPRLILAAPEGIEPSLGEKLTKLGIDVLEYGWQDHYAIFPGMTRHVESFT